MVDPPSVSKVLWWNDSEVAIVCPICEKFQVHRFTGTFDNVLVPCQGSKYTRGDLSCPFLQLSFPFSKMLGVTAYELNKEEKRFVSLEYDPTFWPQVRTRRLSYLASAGTGSVSSSKKWSDILGPASMKKVDNVVVDILLGNVEGVREYLGDSEDCQNFVNGVDYSGDSALVIASRRKSSEVVQLLIDRGANINKENKSGRTPLMEAALWGRYEIVRLLLGRGASRLSQDDQGFEAIHFARPSVRNDRERLKRLPCFEVNSDRQDRKRKMILGLLKRPEIELVPDKEIAFGGWYFQKLPLGVVKLMSPHLEYSMPFVFKTIACLKRGDSFPTVSAMSGWNHLTSRPNVIAGREWTEKALTLARVLGYELPLLESKDHGSPGSFYACHAEKQLITFFIRKHIFLKDQARAPLTKGPSDKGGPLYPLSTAKPPVSKTKATLLLSSPPCDDCEKFKDHVNSVLGLKISLQDCSKIKYFEMK